MNAMYNFHWDASYSNTGVAYYNLTVNGMTTQVYGTSHQMPIAENTSVHAEVTAVDVNGLSSMPATIDFMVPDYIEPLVPPTMPGNFGADFMNWMV